MTLQQLAYYPLWGKPIVMYLGIFSFLVLIATAITGYMRSKGSQTIDFKWHRRLAYLLIILTIFHALLGLSSYF